MLSLLINPYYVQQALDLIRTNPASIDPDAAQKIGPPSEFESGAFVGGETAIIPIRSVIDYRASILSRFGYVASSEAIRQDFNQFANDESIRRIVFDIDSPGGIYSGTPELARDILASRGSKQTIAIANPMAASGTLWVGVAAERFVALGSGQVGSIGALILHTDMSKMFESNGITNTILRSPDGKADFNSLEPLTNESRDHHQQVIEDIAGEFLSFVAKARGVPRKQASENFGQGRMMSAEGAAKAGLIDNTVPSLQSVLGMQKKVRANTRRARLNPRLELARAIGLSREAREKQDAGEKRDEVHTVARPNA